MSVLAYLFIFCITSSKYFPPLLVFTSSADAQVSYLCYSSEIRRIFRSPLWPRETRQRLVHQALSSKTPAASSRDSQVLNLQQNFNGKDQFLCVRRVLRQSPWPWPLCSDHLHIIDSFGWQFKERSPVSVPKLLCELGFFFLRRMQLARHHIRLMIQDCVYRLTLFS